MNGTSYTGDVPDNGYTYGNGTVFRRNAGSITVVLYGGHSSPLAINYLKSQNTWTGWQTYVRNSDLQRTIYNIPQPQNNSVFTISHWGAVVYKSGNIVTVKFNFEGSMAAVSDYTTFFTLDKAYRPTDGVIVNYITQKGKPMGINIGSGGEVKFYNNNVAISNDWLCRQCITYQVAN